MLFRSNAGSDKKEPIKYVFVKDMAQYIIPQSTLEKLHDGQGSQCYRTKGEACGTTSCSGASPDADVTENPTVIPTALMRRFKHAFLVRTPEKAVPSYYKCCQDKMAGFEFFDAAEAGFEELRLLYKWISNPQSTFNTDTSGDGEASLPGRPQNQSLPPPLIDASVLLANPSATIEHITAILSARQAAYPKREGKHSNPAIGPAALKAMGNNRPAIASKNLIVALPKKRPAY